MPSRASTADPLQGTIRPLETLPPGYSKFLGDVIARWAIVEHVMTSCVRLNVRVPRQVADIAVREPRASDRIDMINELMQVRNITTTVDMGRLRTDVVVAEGQRNVLAHSVWCILEGTDQVFLVRSSASWRPPGIGSRVSRRMVPEAIPWGLTNFQPVFKALSASLDGLDKLQRELIAARGPWPGRLP